MENPEGLIQCHAYHQKNATVKNSSKSMMSVVGDSSAEAESSVSIARVQKCNVDNIEWLKLIFVSFVLNMMFFFNLQNSYVERLFI